MAQPLLWRSIALKSWLKTAVWKFRNGLVAVQCICSVRAGLFTKKMGLPHFNLMHFVRPVYVFVFAKRRWRQHGYSISRSTKNKYSEVNNSSFSFSMRNVIDWFEKHATVPTRWRLVKNVTYKYVPVCIFRLLHETMKCVDVAAIR